MKNTIYLVPGRGNTLSDIGDLVHSFDYDVCGRELTPPFSSVKFSEQLEIIQKDLKANFWDVDAKLIGHSFGGYLLLHALSELEPFPGDILLLSPVLGPAIDKERLFISYPPRSQKLLALAEASKFPAPRHMEIHTGSSDNGCSPDIARKIGGLIPGVKVHIVQNQGHELSEIYIKRVISGFLHFGDCHCVQPVG
jgi:predicted alpha/beta hydrolase family esterase